MKTEPSTRRKRATGAKLTNGGHGTHKLLVKSYRRIPR